MRINTAERDYGVSGESDVHNSPRKLNDKVSLSTIAVLDMFKR